MSTFDGTAWFEPQDFGTPAKPPKFKRGDFVKKLDGPGRASWRGRVVGFYQTSITPEGYAVESAYESGSVQIYPASMLEPWGHEL